GRTLASGSTDRTARLWDRTTGEVAAVLQGHTRGITAIAFSPTGEWVATGSADRSVRLWNARTGREGAVLSGHAGRTAALALSPDLQTLAAGSYGEVSLWDAGSGVFQRDLPLEKGEVPALGSDTPLAFTKDGKRLAGGGGGRVHLWDLPGAQLAGTLDASVD